MGIFCLQLSIVCYVEPRKYWQEWNKFNATFNESGQYDSKELGPIRYMFHHKCIQQQGSSEKIEKCKPYEQLTVHTNGGHKCFDQVGIFAKCYQ